MVCLDKMAELDAIVHKDQSAIAMIAAIRGIQAQQWPKLVFHLYRPPLAFNEAHDDSDLWQTYKYTRGEVVSKLLDFVFLHIDICVALGRVEYKSLWAHTQIMETCVTSTCMECLIQDALTYSSIPERILKFTDFLTSRGATRADLYDIIIKKWDDGENYLSWIEVFQIDTATLQEEEEVLDFRIW